MGGCQSRDLIPNDSRHVMLEVRSDKEMRNSYGEEDLSFDLHLTIHETPNVNESTTLGDQLEALNCKDQRAKKNDKYWRRKTMTTTHSGSSSVVVS